MRLIEVRGLGKTFCLHLLGGKRLRALHEVSFDVERGEFLGVAGRSGSGKSTLIKCIYRTYKPSRGSMLLRTPDGAVDLASLGDLEIIMLRRDFMGYVSQFLRPLPRVTALDMVAEPLRERGIDDYRARVEAEEYLERAGLAKSLWHSYPTLFSGGEQQKVNIARGLISRPRLLLLDEPTAGLDYASRERIVAMLEEAKEMETTIIGVFHDREMFLRLADRVILLEEGELRGSASGGEIASMEGLRRGVGEEHELRAACE